MDEYPLSPPRPLPKLCIKKQSDEAFKVSWDAQLSEPGGWAQKKKKKKKKQKDDLESEERKHKHRHHKHRRDSGGEVRENNHQGSESVVRTLDSGLRIRISLGEPRVPEIGDPVLLVSDVEQIDGDSAICSSPVKKKKRKRDEEPETESSEPLITPLKPIKLSLVSRRWTRNDGEEGSNDGPFAKESVGDDQLVKVPPITLQLPPHVDEKLVAVPPVTPRTEGRRYAFENQDFDFENHKCQM